MAILDVLGTYLQSAGIGTLGTNLMLGRLPDDPDACVALFESTGMSPSHVMGSSVAAIDRPRIRVVCRAERLDYPAARTKAAAVRASLGAVRDTTLSGIKIMTIVSTSEIYPVRFDSDDRPVMGCDFTVWIAE
jgi:hypothetical protein